MSDNKDDANLYGVKANGETVLLGTVTMTPRMKAMELIREQFGHFTEGDGSEADQADYICRSLIKWVEENPPTIRPAQEQRYCSTCGSQRPGLTCWKCKGSTFAPVAGWVNPASPPVDLIRVLARQVGYAIAVHGSQERDLDLIATPWTSEAVATDALLAHLAQGLGAQVIATEQKPLGRYAATLQMDGYFKAIDISVTPAAAVRGEPAQQPATAELTGAARDLGDLRSEGWTVAVHNDYRLGGVPHTFWLMTKGNQCRKGEGRTDAEALAQIRAAIQQQGGSNG